MRKLNKRRLNESEKLDSLAESIDLFHIKYRIIIEAAINIVNELLHARLITPTEARNIERDIIHGALKNVRLQSNLDDLISTILDEIIL